MYNAIIILQIALPVLYLATTWRYGREFYNNDFRSSQLKPHYLITTLGFHFLYLLLRTAEFRHVPVTSPAELLSVLGFTLAGAYIFIEYITKVKNTGFFVLVISSFLVTIASIFSPNKYGVLDIFKSELLSFHIVSALLGYSAFVLSAIYGLLYMMLYKKLRTRTFDNIYRNLPSLEALESLVWKSVLVGFFAFTFVLIVGFIWLPQAFPNITYTDPKVITTLIIWLIYAIGIIFKKIIGFQGKKLAVISIVGFVITFLSMALTNAISGFHRFN